MPKLFWKLIGALFILWGVLYEGVLVKHYGWDQGVYFWLCNVSVLLAGIALFQGSKNLVIALLSPLLLTQSVWLLDATLRAALGHDILGLTEQIYQPGIGLFEFGLSLHHFFILPTLIFAAFTLENKKGHPGRIILFLAVVLMSCSYFLFPAEQNVNCAHAPCIPDLEHMKGTQYAILFSTLVTTLSMGIARFFSRSLGMRVLSGKNQRRALFAYLAAMVLASTLSAASVYRKNAIPSFSCKGPWENQDVKIDCRFTTEYIRDWMVLQYRMDNKTNRLRECTSQIEANGKKELLQDGLTIEPKSHLDISILIHYPSSNSQIQLSASCLP